MITYSISAQTPQGPASRVQGTFLLALEFYDAALRASISSSNFRGHQAPALVPMIVSLAFAAELYLKCLLNLDKKPVPKNHRLNVLYGRLSPEMQNRIKEGFQTKSGRNQTELESDLKHLAIVFSEWRYIFEGDGQEVKTNILVAFVKTLHETISDRRPDWISDLSNQKSFLDEAFGQTMTVKNLGGATFLHCVDGTGGTLNAPDARTKFERGELSN